MKKNVLKKTLLSFAAALLLNTMLIGTAFAAPPPPMPEGKGDLNGDGISDYVDRAIVSKHILASQIITNPIALEQADVDDDGTIDGWDLAHFEYAPKILYGDIDKNGQLNAGDITLLRRFILSHTHSLSGISSSWINLAGDLNADGKANAGDYTLFKRAFLDLGFDFPIYNYVAPTVPDGVYP